MSRSHYREQISKTASMALREAMERKDSSRATVEQREIRIGMQVWTSQEALMASGLCQSAAYALATSSVLGLDLLGTTCPGYARLQMCVEGLSGVVYATPLPERQLPAVIHQGESGIERRVRSTVSLQDFDVPNDVVDMHGRIETDNVEILFSALSRGEREQIGLTGRNRVSDSAHYGEHMITRSEY